MPEKDPEKAAQLLEGNEEAAQRLVGRIMLEPGYLQKVVENPMEELKAVGIKDPTQEMIEAIESLEVGSVQNIAKSFERHRIGD
jgi:hypothetical protein